MPELSAPLIALRCVCGGGDFQEVHVYDAPPRGETRFSFSASGMYRRRLERCRRCGHVVSVADFSLDEMYRGDYVSATYGEGGLAKAFARVISLPPQASDNAGRVRRICAHAAERFADGDVQRTRSVCDVGSGLCVFLWAMKAAGWRCLAIDPDPRAAAHARSGVGVEATCADFRDMLPDGRRHDLVTFNKVLEHVDEPIAMLAKSREFLRPGGFVYVEVPDAEAAFDQGPTREEFFVEHLHVFSMASLALTARRAGFRVLQAQRLREPSSKYTLIAFLEPEIGGSLA